MAIVDASMKPTRWEIDSGVDGPYMAIGHLFYESMDAMGAAMGGAGDAMADVPNFTNIESAIQISEIIA